MHNSEQIKILLHTHLQVLKRCNNAEGTKCRTEKCMRITAALQVNSLISNLLIKLFPLRGRTMEEAL